MMTVRQSLFLRLVSLAFGLAVILELSGVSEEREVSFIVGTRQRDAIAQQRHKNAHKR